MRKSEEKWMKRDNEEKVTNSGKWKEVGGK